MTRDEAKNELRNPIHIEKYLGSQNIPTDKNLNCILRTHEDKTPSMRYDKNTGKLHCFACNKTMDIFDLIGHFEGLDGFKEQLDRAIKIFGVNVDNKKSVAPQIAAENEKQSKSEVVRSTNIDKISLKDFIIYDFADKINSITIDKLPAEIKEKALKHFSDRGFDEKTVVKHKLTYIEDLNSLLDDYPHLKNNTKISGYVLPIIANDCKIPYFICENEDRNSKIGKYPNIKGLPVQLYNTRYIGDKTMRYIFVTEGIYDAISIEEAGFPCLSLNSTSNCEKLMQTIKKAKSKQIFIIAMDNDDSGKIGAEKLAKSFNEAEIDYKIADLCGNYSDPNEFFVNERETFVGIVKEVAKSVENIIKVLSTYKIQKYNEKYAIDLNVYSKGVNSEILLIPTGFKTLDKYLNGGLKKEFYVVGALPSLGKSTLLSQIADNIAEGGNSVIYVSLEMHRDEYISKSISRQTYLQSSGRLAKNVNQVSNVRWINEFSECEKTNYFKAVKYYDDMIRQNLFIIHGVGNIGVDDIIAKVIEFIEITGKTPVVIIDYVQILKLKNESWTDKKNMDNTMLSLKRLSEHYMLPVVAISSFSRGAYKNPVDFSSFKESGGIEYTVDVLMGLQYSNIGDNDFDPVVESKKSPRELELVLLKNRRGESWRKIQFLFNSEFNLFEECIDY